MTAVAAGYGILGIFEIVRGRRRWQRWLRERKVDEYKEDDQRLKGISLWRGVFLSVSSYLVGCQGK